jgi:hypothetical protein
MTLTYPELPGFNAPEPHKPQPSASSPDPQRSAGWCWRHWKAPRVA